MAKSKYDQFQEQFIDLEKYIYSTKRILLLCGRFSSGKSTIANKLAGRDLIA